MDWFLNDTDIRHKRANFFFFFFLHKYFRELIKKLLARNWPYQLKTLLKIGIKSTILRISGNFLFNLEHKMFLYMQPFSGMRISCIKIFKNLVGIGKVVHVY